MYVCSYALILPNINQSVNQSINQSINESMRLILVFVVSTSEGIFSHVVSVWSSLGVGDTLNNTYRIRPNHRTVRLGFSNFLKKKKNTKKLVVKYPPDKDYKESFIRR